MTTPAAERLYQAQHLLECEGKGWAVYNPEEKPVGDLPVIYGFNNGGSPGWYNAMLISEEGLGLGGHICSHECYMPHDLGILEGSRPDRHETFREQYPNGYRMEFVPNTKVPSHQKLNEAFRLNKLLQEEGEAEMSDSLPGIPPRNECRNSDPEVPLHDWFAGQALSGMIGSEGILAMPPERIAELSYKIADIMMDEREGHLCS